MNWLYKHFTGESLPPSLELKLFDVLALAAFFAGACLATSFLLSVIL